MDTIYCPEEFNCSEKINIEEYCNKYGKLLLEDLTETHSADKSSDRSIAAITGLDKEHINKLHNKCR